MATISLLLQSSNDPATIYIRLRDGRHTDVKARTNLNISPKNWDKKRQGPSKKLLKDIEFANLDTDLVNLKNQLLVHYNNSKGKTSINSTWLKDFINPQKKASKFSDRLVEYIDTYIAYKKHDVTSATVAKCRVIKQLLIRYENYIGSKLYIKDINNDFKLNFEDYCRGQKYSDNTIAKNLRYIKTYCRDARNNGLQAHPQLDGIKTKYYKTEHIHLTKEEIKKIENIDSSDLTESLINARDWLLISCYSGQRISDFMRFNRSMIRHEKINGQNKPLLEFTQKKTGKLMTIPIAKEIIGILKKNNNEFPRRISDQRYNEYIKKVCKKAGIDEVAAGNVYNPKTKTYQRKRCPKWQLVTSHIGRRSFATNNYGAIPTTFLMYMTGHSTEKMFLTYIGKSNKDIALELTKYF